MISIGVEADHNIRKIDLAQAHSILISGGNESLRDNLTQRIYHELASVNVVFVGIYCLEQIEDQVAVIEAFANEVDERFANESLTRKEKVLFVKDYAVIANPYAKEPSFASRVKRSIEHIAIKGRAVGMHVILVVGRPCVDVMTNSLKKCFQTKICFKTLTGVDSYAVINMRKACEIESNQLVLCREYEYEVLNVLPCARD